METDDETGVVAGRMVTEAVEGLPGPSGSPPPPHAASWGAAGASCGAAAAATSISGLTIFAGALADEAQETVAEVETPSEHGPTPHAASRGAAGAAAAAAASTSARRPSSKPQLYFANDRGFISLSVVTTPGALEGQQGASLTCPVGRHRLIPLTGGFIVHLDVFPDRRKVEDIYECIELAIKVESRERSGRNSAVVKIFGDGTVMQAINHSDDPTAAFAAPREGDTSLYLLGDGVTGGLITVNYPGYRSRYNMDFLKPGYVDKEPAVVYVIPSAYVFDHVGAPIRVLRYNPIVGNKGKAFRWKRDMKPPLQDLAVGLYELGEQDSAVRRHCDTIRGGAQSNGEYPTPITQVEDEPSVYGQHARAKLLVALQSLADDGVQGIVGYLLMVTQVTVPNYYRGTPYTLLLDAGTKRLCRRKGVMSELLRNAIGLAETEWPMRRTLIHRPSPVMSSLLLAKHVALKRLKAIIKIAGVDVSNDYWLDLSATRGRH